MSEKTKLRRHYSIFQYFWILIGLGAITWFSRQAIDAQRELKEIRIAVKESRQELKVMEQKNRLQLTKIHALKNDPFVVEQRLRQETGKARPGEIVLEESFSSKKEWATSNRSRR